MFVLLEIRHSALLPEVTKNVKCNNYILEKCIILLVATHWFRTLMFQQLLETICHWRRRKFNMVCVCASSYIKHSLTLPAEHGLHYEIHKLLIHSSSGAVSSSSTFAVALTLHRTRLSNVCSIGFKFGDMDCQDRVLTLMKSVMKHVVRGQVLSCWKRALGANISGRIWGWTISLT